MPFYQGQQNGAPIIGTMLSEIYVPNIVRLIKTCGFEYAIIDCEHGYFDYTQVANLVAVAAGMNFTMIVRTGSVNSEPLTKYMDIGANGILLANTESVDEAKTLVRHCLYAPDGERGVSTFRAHTMYNPGNLSETMRRANERALLICQIESEQTSYIAEEIANLNGISGLMIGPNDMSQRMGILGHYDHPRMRAALRRVAEGARNAGKWSGIITSNKALLKYCRSLGMRVFCIGSELNMIAWGAKQALSTIRDKAN